ncbi:exo-alpha-sialidase [Shewanella submarina]|uniref:Exo-alpha-sialidase n=1 Tax=Shewanella submarina TaxID=2016376 RepID=A0ABV7GAV0_9GAMM|nr:exo-alpha-sialidase [Shewanella submarina]MCL1037755.1 exo-alpha-sialidase [Shewanella submarina]
MKLQSVACIWDKGEHNAFTDLCRFQGQFYCIFREASVHVSDEADLRILRSDDGVDWHSIALLKMPGKDLRDGKLLAQEARLLVYGAAVDRSDSADPHNCLESWVWQSADGVDFSEPEITISDNNYWLWRVRQAQDESGFYGVAYRAGPEGDVRLYHSDNGLDFDGAVAPLNSSGYVNEADMLFEDGKAEILLRRDPVWGPEFTGLLGTADAPYQEWSWLELSCRIGGPVMFEWQTRLFAVVRLYDDNVRTSLVEIDRVSGEVTEHLTLPSGGDTSYAGVVLEGNRLYISYYSSHEDKTNIYFATVALA